MNLKKLKDLFQKKVDLEEEYKKNELKKHLFTIENSVFLFSFLFNSSYRDSRNYFKYISKDKSFNKSYAITVLNELIKFLDLKNEAKNEIKNIKNNKIVKELLKDQFKEENTDIKFSKDLVSIFIFDASDNQVLMNKNYHQIKTLRKDTNKLLKNLMI